MQKVAAFSQLRDGSITTVTLDETKIVIVRDGSSIHAFAATCPHAGAPLDEGAVCDHRLVCPWHKAVFSLGDGSIVEPPALDGLTRYPSRVEGDDVLVGSEPIDADLKPGSPNGHRLLILGSGAGGTAAAFALRELGFSGNVTMIGDEAMEPYDRTVLSKFVLADMEPSDIPGLRRDRDWKDRRIDRLKATIARVDAGSRRVHLMDGTAIEYDTAILATGATPKVPDIPGASLRGVHTLRNRMDAEAIAAAASPGSHAIIMGSSFIGLEAASALRERDVRVTVVTPEEIPFKRQFGPEIGMMFRDLHEANGVVFRLASKVDRIHGTGAVEAVEIVGGERIAANVVILGVGVTPATTFVDGVRKADDGGIIVDSSLLAAEGLYVIGDSACFPNGGSQLRIEHWRVAQQQGRFAAGNIMGVTGAYDAVPFFWTYHFGKQFEYIGHADSWDELRIDGDLEAQRFVALQIRDNIVRGVIACQRQQTTGLLIERLRQPLGSSEAMELLRQ